MAQHKPKKKKAWRSISVSEKRKMINALCTGALTNMQTLTPHCKKSQKTAIPHTNNPSASSPKPDPSPSPSPRDSALQELIQKKTQALISKHTTNNTVPVNTLSLQQQNLATYFAARQAEARAAKEHQIKLNKMNLYKPTPDENFTPDWAANRRAKEQCAERMKQLCANSPIGLKLAVEFEQPAPSVHYFTQRVAQPPPQSGQP
eukprot:TRINITY_DN33005_c0_g1_i1.p1 TRINITY_DN33005_c0_g1~~TRINITY_DN33005_c0_g1_i1.p1  ORF type:complete len:204 (+),score=25.24 TRINITY_DN33005_c0_g1_i1:81-692(+)